MRDIAGLIEHAGLGLCNWDDVNNAVIDAFPGSFSCVLSQNRQTGEPNFASIGGLTDKQRQDYVSHYSRFNPWNECWSQADQGNILISEDRFPTRLFARNEFINDWLRPIQKNSAAAGVKLGATRDDDIFFGVHYDMPYRDRYEGDIVRLMETCSGHLVRAVEMNRLLEGQRSASVAASALIDRDDAIGCVVDHEMKLIEANMACAAAFSHASFIEGVGDVLHFIDPTLQRFVAETVHALLTDRPVKSTTLILRATPHLWQVRIARVPQYDPRSRNRMFMSRSLAMILIRDIVSPREPGLDRSQLAALGLTRAEIRLCLALSKGLNVSEAAADLDIKPGTVRQQLKAIFAKTGARRQAELTLLLSRLS